MSLFITNFSYFFCDNLSLENDFNNNIMRPYYVPSLTLGRRKLCGLFFIIKESNLVLFGLPDREAVACVRYPPNAQT
jgi:hypothetical protein